MNTPSRVLCLLIDPRAAWAAIEAEAADPAYVLSHYVARLALIPAVAGFSGASVIGATLPGGVMVRHTLADGLFGAIFGYVAACIVPLLLALVLYAMARWFDGRRDFDTAFRVAAFSFTPVWLAGLSLLLPGLYFLGLSGLYGIYLLGLGLPRLLKSRPSAMLLIVATVAAVAFVGAALAAQRVVFGTPGF